MFALPAIIFLLNANAADTSTSISTHQIKWNGVDVWTTDKTSKTVISFENASYPENFLPYFVNRIDCDKNILYKVTVKNPVYATMTDAKELSLIQNIPIPSEIEVKSFKQSERGNYFLKIEILPFVAKEGKILKLQKFDLSIEKGESISKVSNNKNTIHTYASSSVLANGKFVKVKISENGIYKLTYETISSMGVNPTNVRVFGYGGAVLEESFLKPKIDDLPELAIYMNKGGDGIFNAGDYILFYGNGVTSWQYDNSRSMFTHKINTYSNYGYYFITSDAGIGKKIENTTVSVPEGAEIININEFIDYQVHEKELSSLIQSGKTFYGELFNDILNYNFLFPFPNVVKSQTTKIRVDVASASTSSANFTLSLNDTQPQTVSLLGSSDYYEYGKGTNSYFAFTPSTDNLMVNLRYIKPNNTSRGYLNYIEVNARRSLIMSGNVMFFRNIDNINTTRYSRYQLSGANNNIQIWDITDPVNIKKIETTKLGSTLEFIGSNEVIKQYVAIDPTASGTFAQPSIEGAVSNQNLHALSPSEFLIITHPTFLSEANRLADAHRTIDNMSVNVVTTEQVYNEFSSGTPDATSYRWVTKMLYDRAIATGDTQNMPKYLLLFGRGSYDNRKILNSSSENLLMTYQADNSLHRVNSYITDDYFGLLDDGESTNIKSDLIDVGIGRFTVLTTQEAKEVVDKTIGYMNNTEKGIWKNQLCFVGDDGGDSNGVIHMSQADSVARMIYNSNSGFQIDKIYLDAYKQEKNAIGDSYPLAKAKLSSLIHSGLLMLNFTGHAGPYGWTDERILTSSDVLTLYNKKLPLWVAATCDFVVIDEKELSAGEHVLLNPVGGGIGIFAAARTVYSSNNFMLNKAFSYNLFKKIGGRHTTRLGDANRFSKNDLSSTGDANKLSYVLLGDPAVRLNFPTNYTVATDEINGRAISGNDTIKALSVDSISGHIQDLDGNLIHDFNGMLDVAIYDKNQQIVTLNNHNEGAFTYNDRPNILYSGKANIVDGKFILKFMVPKDIRYNYGTGRINYYASESDSTREAQGYCENFIVGGANTNYDYTDTVGPTLAIYLNHPGFVSGSKVNETPLFIANVFDENGINTVGSGIGHDVRLVIDNNPLTSYTLNEYFTTETNNYTSGGVQYKLPVLSEGKHTLTFHIWDLLNNSSVASLDFEVVKGLTPNILGVSVHPNPAKVAAKFVIEHDRPETILETTIDIYDLVGRKIWTKKQNTVENLVWDLTNQIGNKVQQGIYIYKASIKTTNSTATSKANKIIISSTPQ